MTIRCNAPNILGTDTSVCILSRWLRLSMLRFSTFELNVPTTNFRCSMLHLSSLKLQIPNFDFRFRKFTCSKFGCQVSAFDVMLSASDRRLPMFAASISIFDVQLRLTNFGIRVSTSDSRFPTSQFAIVESQLLNSKGSCSR